LEKKGRIASSAILAWIGGGADFNRCFAESAREAFWAAAFGDAWCIWVALSSDAWTWWANVNGRLAKAACEANETLTGEVAVGSWDTFTLVVAAWIAKAWVVDFLATGAFETNGADTVRTVFALDTVAAIEAVSIAWGLVAAFTGVLNWALALEKRSIVSKLTWVYI
jgi:hypothetical protein